MDDPAPVPVCFLTPHTTSCVPTNVSEVCAPWQAERQVDSEKQWQAICGGQWPFQYVADQLLHDCVDPSWETRHGSLLALREILRYHALSAAVPAPVAVSPSGDAMQAVIFILLRLEASDCTLEQPRRLERCWRTRKDEAPAMFSSICE